MRPISRLFGGIALTASASALIAIDQWTKALAAAFLDGRGSVSLLGDFAILVFTRNRGAFLSLGSGLPPPLRTVLLIAFPLAALGFFAWAFLSRGRAMRLGLGEWASLALIIAGGIGNLIDRVFFGEVRDFLNFGIGRLRTGIMNLADLYILAALILMVAAIAARSLGDRRSARPRGPRDQRDSGSG